MLFFLSLVLRKTVSASCDNTRRIHQDPLTTEWSISIFGSNYSSAPARNRCFGFDLCILFRMVACLIEQESVLVNRSLNVTLYSPSASATTKPALGGVKKELVGRGGSGANLQFWASRNRPLLSLRATGAGNLRYNLKKVAERAHPAYFIFRVCNGETFLTTHPFELCTTRSRRKFYTTWPTLIAPVLSRFGYVAPDGVIIYPSKRKRTIVNWDFTFVDLVNWRMIK